MIEYKTRRRETYPRRGDGVWIEGRVPDKPMAQGVNGTIVRLDWDTREAIVLLDGKQRTFEFDELRSCWNDVLNAYIVEEPYVEDNNTAHINGHDE
jgi:hypothetical protein